MNSLESIGGTEYGKDGVAGGGAEASDSADFLNSGWCGPLVGGRPPPGAHQVGLTIR